ncbi:MAG: tRNA pseudouridine(38-40) synthase TruA [Actinomycetota bacterium]|nr:tRNA pseudouridine(38-40) synthase TruA [Actinomycetota bacterium]MDA3014583.1 tRNA pseudouridine(38-40) synthase TruA [Actinomycetota bacterium]MDA3027320.1 tRNA pseudouridine(38-40) synthase TruA [Actinomycetota bacterium]
MSTGSGVRRARFVVSYRGSSFRGSAFSVGVRTVVGDLSEAMAAVLRTPATLTLAGRTDAAVHAHGQVISTDLPAETDLDDLAYRLNRMCGPDIAVRSAAWVSDDFDARFSARWRRYRYHLWNDPIVEPLLTDLTWHVPQQLDDVAMRDAGRHLIGEHDFTSFCRVPDPLPDGRQPSMVRRILDMDWRHREGSPLIRFEITGTAFCHQMVRSIVGTLVDVGSGRIAAESIPSILEARDRSVAGRIAPGHALVLWEVGYDDVGDPDGPPLSSQGSVDRFRDDSE